MTFADFCCTFISGCEQHIVRAKAGNKLVFQDRVRVRLSCRYSLHGCISHYQPTGQYIHQSHLLSGAPGHKTWTNGGTEDWL